MTSTQGDTPRGKAAGTPHEQRHRRAVSPPQETGTSSVDETEAAARVRALAPDQGNLLVLGAAGTGKSTLALEVALRRAQELPAPGSVPSALRRPVLFLTGQRRRAGEIVDDVTRRLGARADRLQVATPSALAFSVVTTAHLAQGLPAPTLLTGADVDAILTELLGGHLDGSVARPPWPSSVPEETLALAAFRHELRDLLTRAAEEGLDPRSLAELGREHQRPQWVAAAQVMGEYEDTLSLRAGVPGRGRLFDHARVLDEATTLLRGWDTAQHGPRPAWSLVVVDDYQDATGATARLLQELARDGAQILLSGNPDVAVQQFRGGRASLLGRASRPLDQADGLSAQVVRLERVWRGTPGLLAAQRVITNAIRPTLTGAAHRTAALADGDTDEDHRVATPQGVDARVGAAGVQVDVVDSAGAQHAHLVRRLREEHLLAQVPWSQMAVIVRSGHEVTALRSALRAAGVPTDSDAPARALKDEPAVQPLLAAVGQAVESRAGRPLDHEVLHLLLGSVIGGLTSVQIHVLERSLRALGEPHALREDLLREAVEAAGRARDPEGEESAPGDAQGGEAVEAAEVPETAEASERPSRRRGVLDSARQGLQRVAGVIHAARAAQGSAAAAEDGAGHTTRTVTASQVLWAAWAATGLERHWQKVALAGGAGSEVAHANLDAVISLFTAAERYDQRTPGGGIRGFLEMIEAQDLPQDTLGARGRRPEAVDVLTASTAAGREWQVVVLAGVQEDSWPNLRLRDTLLGAGDLADLRADAGAGFRDAREKRREQLDDEARQFVSALSRAHRLAVVTAVSDADQRPSMFVEALAGDRDVESLRVPVQAPLNLSGLVATLRAAVEEQVRSEFDDQGHVAVQDVGRLATGDRDAQAEKQAEQQAEQHAEALAEGAVQVLAHLAANRVATAEPQAWRGMSDPTTIAPLVAPETRVRVSPSGVEDVLACPLNWLLTTHGGKSGPVDSAELGTLVHELAEAVPDGDPERLQAELDKRKGRLRADAGTWSGQLVLRRVDAMVERLSTYLRENLPAGYEPSQLEELKKTVETAVRGAEVGERASVTGRIDRLEAREDLGEAGVGLARIVDFKTSGSAVSAKDVPRHAQLAAYQVALRPPVGDAAIPQQGRAAAEGTDARELAPGGAAGARLVFLDVEATATERKAVAKAHGVDVEDLPARPTLREQPPLVEDDPGGERPGSGDVVEGGARAEEGSEPSGPMTVREATALVDQAATLMGGATFVGQVNDKCRYCPVSGVCPVGAFAAGEE